MDEVVLGSSGFGLFVPSIPCPTSCANSAGCQWQTQLIEQSHVFTCIRVVFLHRDEPCDMFLRNEKAAIQFSNVSRETISQDSGKADDKLALAPHKNTARLKNIFLCVYWWKSWTMLLQWKAETFSVVFLTNIFLRVLQLWSTDNDAATFQWNSLVPEPKDIFSFFSFFRRKRDLTNNHAKFRVNPFSHACAPKKRELKWPVSWRTRLLLCDSLQIVGLGRVITFLFHSYINCAFVQKGVLQCTLSLLERRGHSVCFHGDIDLHGGCISSEIETVLLWTISTHESADFSFSSLHVVPAGYSTAVRPVWPSANFSFVGGDLFTFLQPNLAGSTVGYFLTLPCHSDLMNRPNESVMDKSVSCCEEVAVSCSPPLCVDSHYGVAVVFLQVQLFGMLELLPHCSVFLYTTRTFLMNKAVLSSLDLQNLAIESILCCKFQRRTRE